MNLAKLEGLWADLKARWERSKSRTVVLVIVACLVTVSGVIGVAYLVRTGQNLSDLQLGTRVAPDAVVTSEARPTNPTNSRPETGLESDTTQPPPAANPTSFSTQRPTAPPPVAVDDAQGQVRLKPDPTNHSREAETAHPSPPAISAEEELRIVKAKREADVAEHEARATVILGRLESERVQMDRELFQNAQPLRTSAPAVYDRLMKDSFDTQKELKAIANQFRVLHEKYVEATMAGNTAAAQTYHGEIHVLFSDRYEKAMAKNFGYNRDAKGRINTSGEAGRNYANGWDVVVLNTRLIRDQSGPAPDALYAAPVPNR